MGRKAKFTPDQVLEIRKSLKTYAHIAVEFGTTLLTIHKVKTYKGAYQNSVLDFGVPVLNAHGQAVGVSPALDDML